MGLFQHLVTQANRGGAALLRGRREGEETEQRRRLLEDENARRNEYLKQQAGMLALQNFQTRRELRGPSLRDQWRAQREEQRAEQKHEMEMRHGEADIGRLNRSPGASGGGGGDTVSDRRRAKRQDAMREFQRLAPGNTEWLDPDPQDPSRRIRIWLEAAYPDLDTDIPALAQRMATLAPRRPRRATSSVRDLMLQGLRQPVDTGR